MRLFELKSGDTKISCEANSHPPKSMFIHSMVVFDTLGECNWLKRLAIGRSSSIRYSHGVRLPKEQ